MRELVYFICNALSRKVIAVMQSKYVQHEQIKTEKHKCLIELLSSLVVGLAYQLIYIVSVINALR